MSLSLPISLCIINGYPRANRQVLDEAGVSQADDLYLQFLRPYLPNGAFDTLYVADLDVGVPTGAALTSYDGFVWTGSNLTLYHDRPEVTRQIELSRAVFEAGLPQFGSCWGVQMAAVAAGGEVKKNPNGREWCLAREIRLTEAGQHHPLYTGKPVQFDGFIMHLDEVTRVPQGGTVLASNRHTAVQALDVRHPSGGAFWATQYHPEFNLYAMARLLIARKKPLTDEGFFAAEDDVQTYADSLIQLTRDPTNPGLRRELKIGDDVLVDNLRQAELRNWLEFLVVPQMRQAA